MRICAGKSSTLLHKMSKAVFWIRKDPKLFAGSGSETGLESYKKSSKKLAI
jgi:hypothetical protein